MHGIGLVSHKSPRLTNKTRDPYKPEDARRPLESSMVLSVETTLQHPRRGLIKLEDTVAMTEIGHDVLATARVAGTAPATAGGSDPVARNRAAEGNDAVLTVNAMQRANIISPCKWTGALIHLLHLSA